MTVGLREGFWSLGAIRTVILYGFCVLGAFWLVTTASTAPAHDGSDSNARIVAAINGPAPIPFLYLGAKHMVTGLDHVFFLIGVVFFSHRLRDVVIYVSLFTLGHSEPICRRRRDRPFRRLHGLRASGRVLSWTIAGFIVMVITGLQLFYAKPLLYDHNLFFRTKMVILVLAMVNILAFHRSAQKNIAAWDQGRGPVWYSRIRKGPWGTGGPGGLKGKSVAWARDLSLVTSPTRQPLKRSFMTRPKVA